MATRRDFMRMAGAFAGAEIGRHVLSGLGINPETYANAGSIQQENSQEYMLDRAEWYYGKESRIPGITQYAYDHLAKAGTYVVGGADGKGGLIGDIVTLRFGTGVASGKYMLSCEKTINMFNTIINEVAEGRFELQEQYELEIGDVVSHVAVVDEIFEEGVLKHDFHTQSNRSAKVASVTTSQQTPMVIACLDDRLQPFPFASKIEVSAPAMVTGYNFIYAKSEKMILISPKSYQAIVSTDKYCEMSKHEGDFIPSAIIQGGNVIGVPSGANYTYSQEKDAISFEKIPQNLADMLNSQVNWIPLKGQVLDINSYRGMRGLDIDLYKSEATTGIPAETMHVAYPEIKDQPEHSSAVMRFRLYFPVTGMYELAFPCDDTAEVNSFGYPIAKIDNAGQRCKSADCKTIDYEAVSGKILVEGPCTGDMRIRLTNHPAEGFGTLYWKKPGDASFSRIPTEYILQP